MKFSIRDLFLVTLIVALAVGWWVDRGRLRVENIKLRRAWPWTWEGSQRMPLDGPLVPMPSPSVVTPKSNPKGEDF